MPHTLHFPLLLIVADIMYPGTKGADPGVEDGPLLSTIMVVTWNIRARYQVQTVKTKSANASGVKPSKF